MIPVNQHSTTITKKVVGTFKEDIPVKAGYSGFFPRETTPTLMVDVLVQRDNDYIAVDVARQGEGNYNKFSRATEKIYKPPMYEEIYDFKRDEVFMNSVVFGITGNSNANQRMAQKALDYLRSMRKKIERAILKQQAEALQTGIITLQNGDNIDFRRKAGSLVDLGVGNYWNQASTDPIADLANGATFLRDEGNSNSRTVNVVMRSDALNAFLNNAKVIADADVRRIDRVNIGEPQFEEATGFAFHGQVAIGDYTANLWTYNEKYTDDNDLTQYYQDFNKVVMLPGDFMGKTVFAGLQYLRRANIAGEATEIPAVAETDYLLRPYFDRRTVSSGIILNSAPLVIPFTIDKVYTLQVLA